MEDDIWCLSCLKHSVIRAVVPHFTSKDISLTMPDIIYLRAEAIYFSVAVLDLNKGLHWEVGVLGSSCLSCGCINMFSAVSEFIFIFLCEGCPHGVTVVGDHP